MRFTFNLIINIVILGIIITCSPYSLPQNKLFYNEENAFKFYKSSIDYFLAGEYQFALQSIQKAIDINQSFAQFHKFKGDIYFHINEIDKALVSYLSAINYRSNFTDVYQKMGEIYVINGNYDEAIKVYHKVLISDAKQISSFLELADCYLEISRFEMALNSLKDYKKAAIEYEIDPVTEYYFLLGKVYFKLERYKDGIKNLYKIKHIFDERVYYFLGRCYYAVHEYDNGLQCFNKLLSFDNSVGEYYFYRGIYFYNKDDLGDAIIQFKRALELDDSQNEVHYYLGKIYEASGNKEEADKEFQLYNRN